MSLLLHLCQSLSRSPEQQSIALFCEERLMVGRPRKGAFRALVFLVQSPCFPAL